MEIKLLEKITPKSDDEKYIKRYEERLLIVEENHYQKLFKKQTNLKEKINKKRANNGRIQ